MTSLRPYPSYKDSGLKWLDEIPSHWDVLRAKYVLREIDERSVDGDGDLIGISAKRGAFLRTTESGDHDTRSASLEGYKLARSDQLVINIMLAWNGSLAVTPFDGLVSPAYSVFQFLKDIHPGFASHLMRSSKYLALWKRVSTGVVDSRLRLYPEVLYRQPLIIPPLDEQRAIAAFLDAMDARITRFIAARKKMIRLLEEKKQAVINQAVTKGLDPTVPMKDSGVDWLGKVPAHWEVRRLKRVVTSIDQGVSPQSEAGLADDESWGVLKSGCVNGGVFRPEEHKRLPDDFRIDRSLQIRLGNILVSRASGSKHFVGSTGQVESLRYQLILSDKTFRLNIKSQYSSRFVVRAMNSRYYRTQVESAISGAEGLANNLPLSELKNFVLAVPPLDEQERISERLEVETREMATAIERYGREIELVQEYRTRLISDVVTGKLDVRGVDLGELPEFDEIPDTDETGEILEAGVEEVVGVD